MSLLKLLIGFQAFDFDVQSTATIKPNSDRITVELSFETFYVIMDFL